VRIEGNFGDRSWEEVENQRMLRLTCEFFVVERDLMQKTHHLESDGRKMRRPNA